MTSEISAAAPGHNEVPPLDLLRKRCSDNANRQRHQHQPGENCDRRDQLTERGDRHHVAVTDGADGYDRPPESVRDGAKLVRLDLGLSQMHQGRGNQRRTKRNDKTADKRATLVIENVKQ